MYKILDKTSKSVLVRMDFETFEEMEQMKKKSHRRPSSLNNIEYESFSKKELKELMTDWKKSFDSICNSLKTI